MRDKFLALIEKVNMIAEENTIKHPEKIDEIATAAAMTFFLARILYGMEDY